MTKSLHDRFMEKVVKVPLVGCWLWTASTDSRGYGQINIDKTPQKAHRVAYRLFVTEPGSQLVRHICDNPTCVNPEHLELGNQSQNMKDAWRRNRLNPASRLNLRPGKEGYHGAGPVLKKKNQHA